jgi:endonuclease YncB( thermonuclease family)
MKYGQMDSARLYYSAPDFAEALGISIETLNEWENEYPGLFKPRKNKAGKRTYSSADLEAGRELLLSEGDAPTPPALVEHIETLKGLRRTLGQMLQKIQEMRSFAKMRSFVTHGVPLFALFCLFLAFTASPALAQDGVWIQGVVEKVSDGDTFNMRANGQVVKVRMYGVDTPEKKQEFGPEATRSLDSLILGKTVKVLVHNTDRYGRSVGEPWLGDTLNVSLWMVRHGRGWWYKSYSKKRADLESAEALARKENLGLWQNPDPTPPWEFRKQKKSKSKSKKNKNKKG